MIHDKSMSMSQTCVNLQIRVYSCLDLFVETGQGLLGCMCALVEIAGYGLLGYWTVHYFDLKVDWDKKSVSSKTGQSCQCFKRCMVCCMWLINKHQ